MIVDLRRIQELDQPGSYPEMLDEMYRQLDPIPVSNDIGLIDCALGLIDPLKYSDTALVGFLAITGALKDELPSRPALFERIKAHLALSEPESVVTELLRGLE